MLVSTSMREIAVALFLCTFSNGDGSRLPRMKSVSYLLESSTRQPNAQRLEPTNPNPPSEAESSTDDILTSALTFESVKESSLSGERLESTTVPVTLNHGSRMVTKINRPTHKRTETVRNKKESILTNQEAAQIEPRPRDKMRESVIKVQPRIRRRNSTTTTSEKPPTRKSMETVETQPKFEVESEHQMKPLYSAKYNKLNREEVLSHDSNKESSTLPPIPNYEVIEAVGIELPETTMKYTNTKRNRKPDGYIALAPIRSYNPYTDPNGNFYSIPNQGSNNVISVQSSYNIKTIPGPVKGGRYSSGTQSYNTNADSAEPPRYMNKLAQDINDLQNNDENARLAVEETREGEKQRRNSYDASLNRHNLNPTSPADQPHQNDQNPAAANEVIEQDTQPTTVVDNQESSNDPNHEVEIVEQQQSDGGEANESEKVEDMKEKEAEKHEEGGGDEEDESEKKEDGENGEESKDGEHGDGKVEKGHHDKESHGGEYSKEEGDDHEHKYSDGYFEESDEEEGGGKKSDYDEEEKYEEGEDSSGKHIIHKADEYAKKTEFFDESGESGDDEKYGGYQQSGGKKSGGKEKKEHFDSESDEHHKDKKGKYEKGKYDMSDDKYHKKHNLGESYDHGSQFKKHHADLYKYIKEMSIK